jgi:RNA polymerase sigma-70 factor (ECF subfamily)
MKKSAVFLTVLIFLTLTFSLTSQDVLTVENMPPVVVKTVPEAGDTGVDPGLQEISVTFSKDMMTQDMWSWVMISRDSFPEITGDIKFLEDKRTCTARVRLEPGKTYAIWFNSEKMEGFRDTSSLPAIPYLLVFQTKSVN